MKQIWQHMNAEFSRDEFRTMYNSIDEGLKITTYKNEELISQYVLSWEDFTA